MNRNTLLWLQILPVLLFGCGETSYLSNHSATWICLSPAGCARADVVPDFDRAWIEDKQIFLHSSGDATVSNRASRLPSDTAPAGCDLLVGLNLFGHALEPLTICRTTGGYSIELSIPDPTSSSASEWRIELRPL